MNDLPDLHDKLAAAEQWVRDEFIWLDEVARDFGAEPAEEPGPGLVYRVAGQKVLRVHPKLKHLGLGLPDTLRADVHALTAGLRSQRGHAWVNYGPASLDRETVELLLDLAVRQAVPHEPKEPARLPRPEDAAAAPPANSRHQGRDDEADLELILSLVRAFQRHQRETGISSSIRVLREALYFHWEGPRLPPGRKYAPSLLHSSAARDWRDGGHTTALVYEHAIPVNLVIRAFLAEVPEDTAALRSRLDAHAQRVIITKEEDERLTAAGFRSRLPDAGDVWSRYREVGIDPDDFRPWK